jgi:cytochrome c oxidase assembly factor CtaG
MHTVAVIFSAWHWNLTAIVAALVLFTIYAVVGRLRGWRAVLWFLAGDLLLAVVLCSPIELVARNYLFTAEAIERLIVGLTVPYLLVRGMTEKFGRRVPYVVAWIAGMGVLSIWFLPRALNASLEGDTMRSLEMITLVAGGGMFWWPLHAPARSQRIPPMPNALLYLAAATVWCSLLGLFLAFEQPWLVARYAQPVDTLNIVESLVRDWSFTRENDQQTGGLLFWIGAGSILLSEVMFTYYRWYVSESKGVVNVDH